MGDKLNKTLKNFQNYTQSYFASCATGIEEVLSKEVQEAGGKKVTLQRGGVEFKGKDDTALRVILYSRTASRVYKKICSCELEHESQLYDISKNINWDHIFTVDKTFMIKSIIAHGMEKIYPASFKNSMYLGQKFKDGLVDHFRLKQNKRPNVDTQKPDIGILLRLAPSDENKRPALATVFLDLCGRPLHQRSYRDRGSDAPVKENLAAGIIKLMDIRPEDIFIDSMCGSGTFLIEYALIKADIPPSYLNVMHFLRNPNKKQWALLNFLSIEKEEQFKLIMEEELNRCTEKTKAGLNTLKGSKILGYDINTEALRTCSYNLSNALLDGIIRTQKANATQLKPEAESSGIIFCNPPYGARLGESEGLGKLYRDYGDNIKNNFRNYTAYVFTGNLELAKELGLKPKRKFPLFNGPIDCRLLKYEIY
jgi:23S rRNA G2445 N2-methylase RlmL